MNLTSIAALVEELNAMKPTETPQCIPKFAFSFIPSNQVTYCGANIRPLFFMAGSQRPVHYGPPCPYCLAARHHHMGQLCRAAVVRS